MKFFEFNNVIDAMMDILNIPFSVDIENLELKNPKNIYVIDFIFKNHFSDKESFIKMADCSCNFQFYICGITTSKLIIKAVDFLQEDPPLYLEKENGELVLLSESLATVLLTELSLWLFQNAATFCFDFKWKTFKNSKYLHENYSTYIHVTQYPNSIFLREKSFVLYMAYKRFFYFVTKDEDELLMLKKDFGLLKESPKTKVDFKSDILKSGYISDGVLNGTLVTSAINENVPVRFCLENKSSKLKDYDDLVAKAKEVLQFLSPFTNDFITRQIDKEITESVFQQTDEEQQPIHLHSDLRLSKINIYSNGYMFEYLSTKIMPQSVFYVQLSGSFEIDEITTS